jgi:tetratricopeptide (TPR) repeat protein
MDYTTMKGRALLFVPLFCLAAALSLSAQTAEIKDDYYHIVSDGGGADASALLRELELRFEVYNRLFGFDTAALTAPLRVRAFRDEADYDAYIEARLGAVRRGAVYLHYSRPDRRELVVHRGSAGEAETLSHQAFVQFLRAFVSNPPAWMREGFAVFFSTLRFDGAAGALDYTENLAWLESVKGLGSAAPEVEAVLLADVRGMPAHFQGPAWAVVSFLLNSEDALYTRILTEIFMTLALMPDASGPATAEAVMRRISLRTDMESFRRDYAAYLASRKTFAELLKDGQDAYARKDAAAAALIFEEARGRNPAHYAPHYYLGLLFYEDRMYGPAEQHYRSALQYGADSALVNFALGLNAASAGRTSEAAGYLEQAALAAPDRYRRRADEIIARLGGD